MPSSSKNLYAAIGSGAPLASIGAFETWRQLNQEKARVRAEARQSQASCRFAVYDANNKFICD